MKNKYLILFFNNDDNDKLMKAINGYDNVEAKCVFIPIHNRALRAIRKCIVKFNLYGIGLFLNEWAGNVQNYNRIICIASQYSNNILLWISKKNNSARLINYYWDSIEISNYKIRNFTRIENWSFDKRDSKRFSLKYNPQFFVKSAYVTNDNIIYDVVFIGSDRNGKLKDRSTVLLDTYKKLQCLNLKCKFCYLTRNEEIIDDIRISKAIDSKEYYLLISQSKVLLDIVEKGREWMTLRPLLALSNHKKVITNNIYIKDELYYSSQNIFILGQDDEKQLKQFVNSPFVEIPDSNLNYYECSEWLKRFD